MDIGELLSSLGLDKYAAAFAENEIDLDAARHLSDDDLKELGLPMGPRRKFLAGLNALGDAPAQPDNQPKAGEAPEPTGAERRQLTVMFVDLVGSTSLSAGLDPEEMRDVIRGFQNAVAGEITRLDGHVAKFMGDGALVYFGWPQAHENEAERAVRAGLAVMNAIAGLRAPDGTPLAARIGIATGLVVVGDLIGEGSAREETVVGDTPNLAARLQGLAEPGRIVVAEATSELLGGLFELDELGRHAVKGLDEPVLAYAVLGERTLESRFAARGSATKGAIVGRDQELALLMERWGQANAGEGQMVLLTGEAGIGKSRITEALFDDLRDHDHTSVRYQCSPYHTDSALYPTIQQLSLAAGFETGDDETLRLDKLEALLAQGTADVGAQVPLLAPLLGLDGEKRYGALGLSPQQLRARMLQALIDQLVGLAKARPVLFVIEDAHWIDPTTLELVELALDTVARSQVLVLITARPTFEHGFGGHPVVTRLMLNRLGRSQVADIATRVSGGKPLPDAVLDEISSKTDGVPLFVEEIAKAVLESDALREEDGAYVLAGPLSALTIPATLHDSLMARLDRLRPVKEVAQMASVIGRAFDYRTLAAVAEQSDEALTAALDGLVEAELVFRRGTPPEADYLFKHALVRDAAYESLLKSRRQAIHADLLSALEAREDAQPEILAHHAEEAGDTEKAIDNWTRAGDAAVARPAYREAISHFENALRLLRQMPADDGNRERELRLLINLGQALIAAHGYGAGDTVATFVAATELAETLGDELNDKTLQYAAIYGQWSGLFIRSIAAPAHAERLLALTEAANDQNARLVALRVEALERLNSARFRDVLACADEIVENYDPVTHRDLALRYGHDALVAANMYRSWSLYYLGYADQAIDAMDATVAWALERDHGNTTGYAMGWGGVITNVLMRRIPETVAAARRALPVCTELATPLWYNYARVFLGWGLAHQGDFDDGLSEIDVGIAELSTIKSQRWFAHLHALKAEAHMLAGQPEESKTAMAAAFAYFEKDNDLPIEAELHRLAGWLMLAGHEPDADAARSSFERAIEIARSRESKAIELRAATGLAGLLRDQGKKDEARDLLAPIYGWFTEGFETPDLIEAKALLDTLG